VNELVTAATAARVNAHCPYSGYPVGAAVRDERGRIFAGCNVENASYGLSVCAERNAVFAMVAAGGREVKEVVLITRDGGTPCGACLQVLAEFGADDLPIHIQDEDGSARTVILHDLLSSPFRIDT